MALKMAVTIVALGHEALKLNLKPSNALTKNTKPNLFLVPTPLLLAKSKGYVQ